MGSPEASLLPIMSPSPGSHRSLTTLPAVMFIVSMAVFVHSFLVIKLVFLTLFLVTSIVDLVRGKTVLVYPRLVWFYLTLAVAGIIWSMVGLFHSGNFRVGVVEAFRIYSVWSLAFLVLYSLFRSGPSLGLLHTSMVWAGIVICMINFVGLYDQISGMGLIPPDILDQLELRIGLNEGYIRITSSNIGILFLVVPYLLSLQFRADAGHANSPLAKLSLVLCLILAAVSGRRALWLVVALTPFTVFLLSLLTHGRDRLGARGRRMLMAYWAAGAVGVAVVSARSTSLQEVGFVRHLLSAFSPEDERSRQQAYLLDGFAWSPVLGSGFGAYAGYLRSDERPWTYELTYQQMLFNIGVVGVAVLGSLLGYYLVLVLQLLRQVRESSAIPFALLVAFCSLLLGSYTNPYMRSFDFLFFVGILPYLSTFQHGFAEPPESSGRQST